MEDFLERVNKYAHLIKDGGLLVDPQELEKFEKRTVSVFVVDKHMQKVCQSTIDVLKSLMFLGFLTQQIVLGIGAFIWYVQLPTPKIACQWLTGS